MFDSASHGDERRQIQHYGAFSEDKMLGSSAAEKTDFAESVWVRKEGEVTCGREQEKGRE